MTNCKLHIPKWVRYGVYTIPNPKYQPRWSYLCESLLDIVDGLLSLPLVLIGVHVDFSIHLVEWRLMHMCNMMKAEEKANSETPAEKEIS